MADRNEGDPRRKKYVEARARGLPREQSAVLAGFSGADKSGAHIEEGAEVQKMLAKVRASMAIDSGVTKNDIIEGFKAAAALAQTMADPAGMVAAWRELGKMLGHYAPEVRKLEKGINKGDLKAAIEGLSDDELRKISRGRVIDGEFTREDTPQLSAVLPK